MSTIDWTRFTCAIPVNAPMKDLYAAWTSAAALERWFLRKAVFKGADGKNLGRSATITKGCSYVWEWYGYDGREKGLITKANGKDHLQFTFASSVVDVRLKKHRKAVVVELIQSGIPTDNDSKKNIRLGCHVGWTFWMANLKSVHEGGLNLRNTDESIKGMINN